MRLTAGGQSFKAEVRAIAGDQWIAEKRLLPEQIEAKFRRFAAAVLPEAAVESAIATCRELESLASIRPMLIETSIRPMLIEKRNKVCHPHVRN